MSLSIGLAEILIAGCTLLGPILAVQAQKAVERASQRTERKLKIFETLVSTFATRLAPEHVQALNLIELAFRPVKGLRRMIHFSERNDAAVVDSWRVYSVHLNTDMTKMNDAERAEHVKNGDGLFKELMFKMSDALGYGLTRDILAKGTYYPLGNFQKENMQVKLLDGASKVFANERNLGLEIKSFPTSPEAIDLQLNAYRAFLKLTEDGRIHIASGE
jgi:hypothetical protein